MQPLSPPLIPFNFTAVYRSSLSLRWLSKTGCLLFPRLIIPIMLRVLWSFSEMSLPMMLLHCFVVFISNLCGHRLHQLGFNHLGLHCKDFWSISFADIYAFQCWCMVTPGVQQAVTLLFNRWWGMLLLIKQLSSVQIHMVRFKALVSL